MNKLIKSASVLAVLATTAGVSLATGGLPAPVADAITDVQTMVVDQLVPALLVVVGAVVLAGLGLWAIPRIASYVKRSLGR